MNKHEALFLELVDEGLFSIDDNGAIWRHNNGSKRRAEKKSRYLQVGFNPADDRRYVYAHRVVYLWASGRDIPEGMQVNHRDGDKHNNRPDNLELVTQSQNGLHATRELGLNRGEDHGASKLTRQQVREIRRRYAANGTTQARLAEEYGVHHTTISWIVNRKTWKHIA
jgi:hypothetical protein